MFLYNSLTALLLLPPINSHCYSALFFFTNLHSFLYLLISPSSLLMEDRKEKNAPWLSVPQFGDWDQKGQLPDYSMDFSKIREMRKQNKRDPSRASLGNEEDFINPTATIAKPPNDDHHYHQHAQQHSPTARRSIFSYFNCCVKA